MRQALVLILELKSSWILASLRWAEANAVVIVATIRALKQHGNVAYEDLKDENVEAMLTGCGNLSKAHRYSKAV